MHKRRCIKKIILILIVVIVIGLFIYKYCFNNNKVVKKKSINYISDDKLFRKYRSRAQSIVSGMSINEKVGQLFLVRYRREDVEYLSNFYPGGYILFARDFQNNTPQSMKEETDRDNSYSKYPLILGVDEEGGYVSRVSRFKAYRSSPFLSPREYYEKGGYPLLESMEKEKANLLKSIGLNLNLAPVVDVSVNSDDFIYNRAFGKDALETSIFSRNMVKYSKNNGINSCLKHFPGYGSNVDTHTSVAIDKKSYEELSSNDYKPFISGIDEGAPCVLVSHNIVESIDSSLPSSLSEKVHDELRQKLKFSGIIITDDLAMDAVSDFVRNKEAATLAINAGNDMIITSDFLSMKNELLDSIKDKKIKMSTINRAVTRVIEWKLYSGLFKEE